MRQVLIYFALMYAIWLMMNGFVGHFVQMAIKSGLGL